MATNKDFIVKNGLSVGEDISVSGSVTSHLQFDDGIQLQLGTDGDLLLYHTGGNSYIDSQTINLVVDAPLTTIKDGADVSATFDPDGAVGLYNAGDIKLLTTSTGVDITGNAVLTGELHGPASFVIDPTTVGDNTGEVVIKGDLTVEGTTTTINSTQLDVADKNITLNFGAGDTSLTANNAGITIQDAIDASTDATILWNKLDESFDFSHAIKAGNFSRIGEPGRESVFRHSTSNNSAVIFSGSGNMEIRGELSDTYQIFAQSGGNVGIGKIPATGIKLDVAGDITSSGTITGSDYSGITMGGSLSGSHDNAKVQYGNSFSGTPAQGHFFFDALNQKLKVYTGSAFVDAVPAGGGGGGGSGSSDATATFRKYTYTLTGTTNAISGKEDDEVTTGDFISGRLYEITVVGDTNFTSIGSSANVVGTQFTATDVGGGTTGKAKEVLFYATGGTQNIEVYVNGVKAVEGSSNDYVATTGTSVTFTSNLASGDIVDVQVYELLTNDSYYLKTETYTQTEINSQIATGTSSYLPLVGGELTGNLVMSGTSPQLQFETSASHPNFQIAVQENVASTFEISSGATDADATDDTYVPRLTVNANGRVGIGTGSSVPDAGLKVITAETGIAGGWIRGPNYGLRVSGGTSDSNYALRIADGSDAVLATFNGGGHLGINTTSPGDTNEGAGLRVHKYIARNQYYSPAGSYGISGGYVNNTNDKVWISVDSAYNQSSAESAGIFLSPYHGDANGFHTGYTIKSTNPGKALVVSEVTTAASTGNPAVETEVFRIDSGGSVFSTNNQPTIRPTLNLDFANSKELDSRITFERDSIASYYDSRGTLKYANVNEPRFDHNPYTGESKGLLIEEARTPILTYSDHVPTVMNTDLGGYWKANYAVAPNGKMQAGALFGDGSASARASQSYTGAGTYTMSIYAKNNASNANGRFAIWAYSGGWVFSKTYTWDGDTVVPSVAADTTIEVIGNGWVRVTATWTTTGNGSFQISPGAYANYASGDSTLFWGLNLEKNVSFHTSHIPSDTSFTSRSSTAKYHDKDGLLKTAPKNRPRYGYRYNGNKWVETGLQLEAAATNRIFYSNWLTNVQSGCDFFGNNDTSPTGAQNAGLLHWDANSTNQIWVKALDANGAYTCSGYFKYVQGATRIDFTLYAYQSSNGGYRGVRMQYVNNTKLNITNAIGSNPVDAYGSEFVGNGWHRVWFTTTLANSSNQGYSEFNINRENSVPDTGTSSDWLYYGGQMEEGRDATSHIEVGPQPINTGRSWPNSGVTRSADVASSVAYTREKEYVYTKLGDWYNANFDENGTVLIDVDSHQAYEDGVSTTFFGISDDTNLTTTNCKLSFHTSTTAGRLWIRSDSGSQNADNNTGTRIRLASSYDDNTVITRYVDGSNTVKSFLDVTAGNNTVSKYLVFGEQVANGYEGNFTIKHFAYYPEALSANELTALVEE